jgi:hypothetical protein
MTVNITFNGSSYNVQCTEDGRVALDDILAKFAKKIDISQSFSHASLSDSNDSTNKLLQDENKYFTCRTSGQYALHLNVPATIVSIPSTHPVSTSAVPLPAISPTYHAPVSMRVLSISRAPKSDTSTLEKKKVILPNPSKRFRRCLKASKCVNMLKKWFSKSMKPKNDLTAGTRFEPSPTKPFLSPVKRKKVSS